MYHVLVLLDGDDMLISTLERVLRRYNYKAGSATKIEDGVKYVKKHKPDIAFVNMFFQAMILSFTFNSFKGRRVNWSSSFRQAAGKWFGILCWSFVDGTVGLFLGKSRRGRNRFSTFALSGIWKILTIMVLPVILFEDVGLKGTVKRATGLFRASWGENISGNMGIGVFVFAATLAMIAVVTVIAFFLKAGEIFTMDQMEPFFMGVFYVYGVFLAILTSSIHAVFEASIYYYSLEKEEPGVYKRGLMDSAIKGY